ncbi:glycosyltransferase family 87 protein [Kibdelosporangium persicum]|uniref:Alpha-1,2-mannosyltransferase/arabinofuranan 3-O-arabinosyltransferase n=1 Tax=Kibdelosporangium persicum TaxID=2698649 RepID=A0ABX2FAP9_9PSEU|nr:Alpha-1,2-mannosyltransferase/arabinofuranan 3-O-arabinosyltransferase [Kibdelosporangium persicum]
MTLWLLVAHGSANVDRVLSTDMGWHADFDTFHRSAVALLHGDSIYDTGAKLPNLNPPFWTVLLAPFGFLGPLTAYRLFGVLTAAFIVSAGLLVARELPVSRRAKWLLSAAFVLSSPLMGTVALGQVYGLLVLGLAVAWVGGKRDRLVLAGVALGLVVAIKPTLAPILLLPVVRRQRHTMLAAAAAVAAATIAGLAAGPENTVRWLQVLRIEQLSTFGDNASLPSLVARFGGPAWLGFVVAGALLIYTLRKVRHDPDIALWAVTAATLLLSPVAWHNYLVLCFPGVYVVLRRRRSATTALMVTLPLIGVEWGLHLWHGDSLVDKAGQSLYCFVLLTYWYALAVQHDRDDPGQVGQARDLGGAEHRPARAADQ